MTKLSDNPYYQTKRAPYTKAKGPRQTWAISFEDRIAALEVEMLCQALKEAGGSPTIASENCGMLRSTFCFKMKKYALSAKNFK